MLGASGAWPTADEPCSGFLVEHEGFRLLIDVGYATLPRLQRHVPVGLLDAVVVSHCHPDHCADLNPLLRARALDDEPPPRLPVFALPGALDAVLALDRRGMLDDAYTLNPIKPGWRFGIGPFTLDARLLPHWVPNVGLRVTVGGATFAYTGDCGPDLGVIELAAGADLLIAEATYPDQLPPGESSAYLTSARDAGLQAAQAGAGRLLLTHLWPGTEPDLALQAAARGYSGDAAVAVSGLSIEL